VVGRHFYRPLFAVAAYALALFALGVLDRNVEPVNRDVIFGVIAGFLLSLGGIVIDVCRIDAAAGGPPEASSAAERDIVLAKHFAQRRNAKVVADVANLLLGKADRFRNLGVAGAVQRHLLDSGSNTTLFC